MHLPGYETYNMRVARKRPPTLLVGAPLGAKGLEEFLSGLEGRPTTAAKEVVSILSQ